MKQKKKGASIKSGQLKSDQAESGSVRVRSQSVPPSLTLIQSVISLVASHPPQVGTGKPKRQAERPSFTRA